MTLSLSAVANVNSANVQVDTTGLNADDVAKLVAEANKLKNAKPEAKVANISETVRKEAGAWGELGSNMGKAIVGGAKEIGMAANDFAGTPLGKVTVGIVAYKLIGKDILKMLIGFIILVAGISIGVKLIFTSTYVAKTEYQPRMWGLYHTKVVTERKTFNDDTHNGYIIIGCLACIISLVAGLATIF